MYPSDLAGEDQCCNESTAMATPGFTADLKTSAMVISVPCFTHRITGTSKSTIATEKPIATP